MIAYIWCKLLQRHEWGKWEYIEEGECSKQKVCARCKKVESDTIHKWGDWEYVAEGECSTQKVCARCKKAESNTIHEWGKWTEDERFCDRCSLKDDRKMCSNCDGTGRREVSIEEEGEAAFPYSIGAIATSIDDRCMCCGGKGWN